MLLQSSSLLSLKWSTNPSICTFHIPCHHSKLLTPLRFSALKTRAIHDEKDQNSQPSILIQDKENELLNQEVEESVRVLKNAAKTRKVPAEEILAALAAIERAKIDSSRFLETLGGAKSPGRTWMLIFTADKGLGQGRYFPITAIQRFDAAAQRIENGVYLGPLGFLTFEGPFSWKNRILAFVFERLQIKVGPFNPFDISIKGKEEREPSNKDKDPFFIWFYIDEEIAVARGRSGGTAFWVRCRRVGYS
ncbi:hypothetical protein EJD97_001536 [Solanum chilense]|uniref:Plastid lipid-associated protein/fibrillin conserved domain-containing protein n=1 Tax=Solanum chilense TaxID=4083 RepID=A0A6N2C146_SOLCI|nr:hypothetical protein EJD97_001536 [Solanum chilense]